LTVDPTLDDQLRDLAAHLDVPDDGAALAAAVGRRIRAVPPPTAALPTRWSWRRRAVWVPAAVVAAVTGLVASPAVGDWFGIRGVEVVRRDASPTTLPRASSSTTTTTTPLGSAFGLGQPSTLADAARALGVEVLVPGALGPPDAVWLETKAEIPFVSLVYAGGPLVSQFEATMTSGPILTKTIGPDARVTEMTIDGRRAMWLEGVHDVVLRAPNGDYVPDRVRSSDSVLLVQAGRLTVRIETTTGRDEAVRIARTLPPT
jgi:hypothetical protein